MNDKPSCLGLLNAIAVGESRGYELLSEWGKRAQSPKLTQVLNLVAIREHEHAAARFDEHLAKSDESIDPQTGALLGRFIAEERDSGKRLRSAYQQLDGPQSEDAVLKQIVERLDRLSGTLEELKTLRR